MSDLGKKEIQKFITDICHLASTSQKDVETVCKEILQNLKLQSQLKKAEVVVDFYANRFNMNRIANGVSDDYTDDCPKGCYGISGGKRAREYRKEFPKEGE